MTKTKLQLKPDFSFRISKSLLTEIVNITDTLRDELYFLVSRDGIKIHFMDYSHISMLKVILSPHTLSNYLCTFEGKFGIRIDELKTMLKFFSATELIQFELDHDNENYLVVSSSKLSFKIRLIEYTDDGCPDVKIDWTTKILFEDIGKFVHACDVLHAFDLLAYFKIVRDNNKSSQIKLVHKDESCFALVPFNKIEMPENSESLFSAEMCLCLRALVKKKPREFLYRTQKNFPCQFRFQLDQFSILEYTIAPRLEEKK